MMLRPAEWIAGLYFAGLAVVAFRRAVPASTRRRLWGGCAFAIAAILGLGSAHHPSVAPVRDWAPLAYVWMAYRLPALLVTSRHEVFERWLITGDRRWSRVLERIDTRLPSIVREVFEAAYLACYLLLPLGYACLLMGGHPDERDRYWLAVMIAAALCYGGLPWLAARTPRDIGPALLSPSVLRRVNRWLLSRASVGHNTFPSGHAAMAVAIALAVSARMPVVGGAIGCVAIGVVAGSVLGRYHYSIDALAGIAVGIVAAALSRAAD
jgi:membrane-associated phospholipid phosphatase